MSVEVAGASVLRARIALQGVLEVEVEERKMEGGVAIEIGVGEEGAG